MLLSSYVETLQESLRAGLATADQSTREAGERLAMGLESATRLALLEALSDAAAEITTALEEAAVEVHLRGQEPQLVVRPTVPEAPAPSAPEAEGGGTARITLRLPEALKGQAESAAAAQGVSVNTWLVAAVGQAVQRPARTRSAGRSLSGYIRG